MKWKPADIMRAIVGIAAFAYSAWIAFLGLYVNVARIQSTFFSVSGVAFVLMVFGFTGAVSCIAVLRFPRSGGITASLAIIAIAGIQIYDMAAIYRIEFLFKFFERIALPILLAGVVFTLFAVEPRDRRLR